MSSDSSALTSVVSKVRSRLTSELSRLQQTDSKTDSTSTTTMSKPWAIVAGVGPGTGASVARRFAQSYSVALLARNPDNFNSLVDEINSAGGKAVGISTDTADVAAIKSAFEQLKGTDGFQGRLAAAVYNVGGRFIRKPFLELSEEEFETGWKTNG